MELKRVKYIRSHRRRKAGDVVELFPPVANLLVKRNIVEEVVAPSGLETAMIAPQEKTVRRSRKV